LHGTVRSAEEQAKAETVARQINGVPGIRRVAISAGGVWPGRQTRQAPNRYSPGTAASARGMAPHNHMW